MPRSATTKKKLIVVSGSVNPDFAKEVARLLGTKLTANGEVIFKAGEMRFDIGDSVRDADAVVVQEFKGDVGTLSAAIIETFLLLRALKEAGAKRRILVCPLYPYARQDKKQGRQPISARLMADLFGEAGANHIICVDLHSSQIEGFFVHYGPLDNLFSLPVLIRCIKTKICGGESEDGTNARDVTMVSPDIGRAKLTQRFADEMGAEIAIIYKRRLDDVINEAQSLFVIGPVSGRKCVLVDDMIDTGGTIEKAVKLLKEQGAAEIWVVTTHPVMSGDAAARLGSNPDITGIIYTNTLPLEIPKGLEDKFVCLSVAELIAGAIQAVTDGKSVSKANKAA